MNANKSTSETNSRLNRIKFVSKVLKAIFLAAMIVQGLAILAAMVVVPIAAATGKLEAQLSLENCCSLGTLPLGFIVAMYFYRFFSRLKDGQVFDLQTIKYLEAAGKWWIILGFVRLLVGAVVVHAYSLKDVTVSADGITAGLIIFCVAWVFREGQKLQEEQELTV